MTGTGHRAVRRRHPRPMDMVLPTDIETVDADRAPEPLVIDDPETSADDRPDDDFVPL